MSIRDANTDDCLLLTSWWSDGSIMAHAGFPHGRNTNFDKINAEITNDSDETRRRLILEKTNKPIDEMSFCFDKKVLLKLG